MTSRQNRLDARPAGTLPGGGLRASLRARREARAAYRVLKADLASYTSDAEVGDLLAALSDHDGAEAEQIRSILTVNLSHRQRSAA